MFAKASYSLIATPARSKISGSVRQVSRTLVGSLYTFFYDVGVAITMYLLKKTAMRSCRPLALGLIRKTVESERLYI